MANKQYYKLLVLYLLIFSSIIFTCFAADDPKNKQSQRTTKRVRSLVHAHGILSVFGWIVVPLLVFIVSRFGNHDATHRRFEFIWSCQVVGYMIGVVAWVLGYYAAVGFAGATAGHIIIGEAIFGVAFGQLIIAFFRPDQEAHPVGRCCWNVFHALCSAFIVLAGIGNGYLGYNDLTHGHVYESWTSIVYSIVIAVLVSVFALVAILK